MFELDFSVIPANSSLLWEGIKMTFLLTGLAIIGGIILGTFLALLRIAKIPILSQFSAAYVNFFRSLPLILVIFWLFFLVPLIVGRPVGAFSSVLVAFILFEAAYYSEIIRAGINSVRLGQLAAARAIGLTYIQSMRCYSSTSFSSNDPYTFNSGNYPVPRYIVSLCSWIERFSC